MGQGGPQPPAERFGARQQDLGVLPAPGATTLSVLSARPCLTTATQGLFLPFTLLSDSGILSGCAPYPNKPCVAGREHGLLQKNELILHMWNQAPNLCKQGMLQPPAGTALGMPYQKGPGVLQGSWLGWENADLPQSHVCLDDP